MKKLKDLPFATACSLVFMPPPAFAGAGIWSTLSGSRGTLFYPQARGRAVRLQVGRIDHECLRLRTNRSQTIHHSHKHTGLAPAFPTAVQRLVQTIVAGAILPAQFVAVDEHDIAQHAPVIHSRRTVVLKKNVRSCSIFSFVSQNRSLNWVSLRSLDQIVTLTSMGPDPSRSRLCRCSRVLVLEADETEVRLRCTHARSLR